MARLNLVIADRDDYYAKYLGDYIMMNHSNRFKVFTLSQASTPEDYDAITKADILLHSLDISITANPSICAISLTEGLTSPSCKNALFKYQPVERMVAGILSILSSCCEEDLYTQLSAKTAKTISFYSPVHNTIKTVAAVSAAIFYASKGCKVFYLSLERFQATEILLGSWGGASFSDVIFRLKDNGKNLAARLEGMKSVDGKYGIHFFEPPQNSLDMDQLEAGEVERLVNIIKNMGGYDILVLDLPQELDKNILPAFVISDQAFICGIRDDVSLAAVKLSASEIIRLCEYDKPEESNKFKVVIYTDRGDVPQTVCGLRCYKLEQSEVLTDPLNAIKPGSGFSNEVGCVMEQFD